MLAKLASSFRLCTTHDSAVSLQKLMWVVLGAGCGKVMPAWQKWYQMQDSFDFTPTKAVATAKGTVKQKPRLQSITSAVFPPVCLTETAKVGPGRHRGWHSQMPRRVDHMTSKLATRTNTATRLVLTDRSMPCKAIAPEGKACVDLLQRHTKRS